MSSAIASAIEEQSAATAEITRNVTQTAQDVASRIARVSDETVRTGNRANDVRKLSGGVDQLRDVVIRTVRTAAA